MPVDTDPLEWLSDADPALRWQVERDLAGAAPDVWQATRDWGLDAAALAGTADLLAANSRWEYDDVSPR